MRVVPRYKHLGGVLHHKGLMMVEVRARIAQAWQAYQARRRQIFGQRQVSLRDKMVLFKSLICSVLFYGAGTWPTLNSKELRALRSCYVGICRAILRYHFAGDVFRLSEDRVLALTLAPSLSTYLHVERLTYLRSFCALNVPEAWALAHAECHWLAAVRGSLAWLWSHSGTEDRHDDWECAWPEWRELLTHRPRMWKRVLRRAQQSVMRKEVLLEGWQQCKGTLVRGLVRMGASAQGFRDVVLGPDGTATHFCGRCQRLFGSRQQWAVHAFKTHQRTRIVRHLADGQQCPVCLRQYPTHIAMCAHLEYSQRCRLRLLRSSHRVVPGPGIADHGLGFLGAVKQGFGPHPYYEPSLLAPDALVEDVVTGPLKEALHEWACEVHITARAALEGLRRALCADCVVPAAIPMALRWISAVVEGRHEDMSLQGLALVCRAIEWAQEHWTPQWLCQVDEGLRAMPAVYQHSDVLLLELDFEGIAADWPVIHDPVPGFLACLRCHLQNLSTVEGAWGEVVVLDDVADGVDWTSMVHDYVGRGERQGLVVLCLAGLEVPAVPDTGFLSHDHFVQLRRVHLIFQDAVLATFQLWSASTAFAIFLPPCDPGVHATLGRLPGVSMLRTRGHAIYYNCPKCALPQCCFTLN